MPHFDTAIQSRLHAPWAQERERTIARLYASVENIPRDMMDERDQIADRTAAKICKCGRYAAAYQGKETGKVMVSQAHCKSRLCPRCNAIRANQLRQAVTDRVQQMDTCRMLTLTLKHDGRGLVGQVDHLVKSFRRLRRQKAWKAHITGGISVIEIKPSKSTTGQEGGSREWNAHLHILCDGTYWAQQQIADAWEKASEGSRVVDIRLIPARSSATRYVTKYVAKCNGPENLSPDELAEYAHALHGLRQVQTFGTMHGRTTPKPDETIKEKHDFVVPLGPLVAAKQRGDERAGRIYRALHLASKLRVSPDTAELPERDLKRSRWIVGRAWDWWSDETRSPDEHTTPGLRRRSHIDRSDHGTERLWKDNDRLGRLARDGIADSQRRR